MKTRFVGFLVLILLISQGNLAYSKEARGVTKDSIIKSAQ